MNLHDKKFLSDIGLRVRGHRQARKWTQAELAERCELHRTFIGSVERGERTCPFSTCTSSPGCCGFLSAIFSAAWPNVGMASAQPELRADVRRAEGRLSVTRPSGPCPGRESAGAATG